MTALRDVFTDYLEALNARRFEQLDAYIHPVIRFNGEEVTRAEYVEAIRANTTAVPDLHWRIEDLVTQGDQVAVRLTDTGTPRSAWLGSAPTGVTVTTPEFAVYRFDEARITEMWFLLDVASVAAQLGGSAGSPSAKDPEPDTTAPSPGERQVLRYRPQQVEALNHNDLRAFLHSWFAAFDHRAPAEFFLGHLDDADMTFNLDGQALATDHASFRTWYADALEHIPWDFHDVLDGVRITGNLATGWTAEFQFRHVGQWQDSPQARRRLFNRVLAATWHVVADRDRFVIHRYELVVDQDVIPL